MAVPTLIYFPNSGRAEPIRLAFVIGSVPFTNKCVDYDEFLKMKPTLPLGQLPVLLIENEKPISQSDAILRYVGKLGGLYPSDSIEALKVDEMLDMINDFITPITVSLHAGKFLVSDSDFTHKEKTYLMESFIEKYIPKYIGLFENKLICNYDGWLVGTRISIADIKLYHVITTIQSGALEGISSKHLGDIKHVAKLVQRIRELPEVSKWYSTCKVGIHYKTQDYP